MSRESEESFLTADIQGYDLILGHPWLHHHDPDIHWRNVMWRLRHGDNAERTPPTLLGLEDFQQEAKGEDLTIFALLIAENEREAPSDTGSRDRLNVIIYRRYRTLHQSTRGSPPHMISTSQKRS